MLVESVDAPSIGPVPSISTSGVSDDGFSTLLESVAESTEEESVLLGISPPSVGADVPLTGADSVLLDGP